MCIRRFVCLLVSRPCCIVCVPPAKLCVQGWGSREDGRREEGLRGGAAFAVVGEVGGALEAGLPGEDAEHGHEDGTERAGGLGVVEADAVAFGQGVGVLPLAGADEALAGRAVEGAVAGVADLLEAEDELAQALGRIAERVGVALGRGRGGADAESDALIEGGV